MKSNKLNEPRTGEVLDGDIAKSANSGQIAGERGKRRRLPGRRGFRVVIVLSAVFLVLVISFTALFIGYYPSTLTSKAKISKLIFNDVSFADQEFKVVDKKVFIRYDIIKKMFDSSLFWEPESNRIIVTTSNKLIEMNTKLLTTYINYKPVSIDVPTFMDGDNPYVSLDFLAPVYGLKIEYLSSGIATIDDYKKSLMIVEVKLTDSFWPDPFLKLDTFMNNSVFLREKPLFGSPRIKGLVSDEKLIVYSEENGWYKVRTSAGMVGFINKNSVKLKEIVAAQKVDVPASPAWKPTGGKINLTWDYSSRAIQDMSSYKPIPGLNVISPTWFSVTNKAGDVRSFGSLAYVDWAHSQGLQVWALFSNGFSPSNSSVFLREFEIRKKIISQIILLSDLLNIDGINIDFEDVNYDDKDYLTQFVREITTMLHEQGLTVSMDVTIRSTNPNWSMVYDRPELAKVLDYMAVMTYDEHWATSPVSGSVASLPWVKEGLERILEQIPNDKLLLGVPFYTRIWTETKSASGDFKVTSKAYSMAVIKNALVKRNVTKSFDPNTGQNYAEYEENGTTNKVWIEDDVSMRSRIKLVRDYNLAGVASWRKGFEEAYIWDVIKEELNKRP
jgi:spore germination protein YaaH